MSVTTVVGFFGKVDIPKDLKVDKVSQAEVNKGSISTIQSSKAKANHDF